MLSSSPDISPEIELCVPKGFSVTDQGVFIGKAAMASIVVQDKDKDNEETEPEESAQDQQYVCSRLDILGNTSDDTGSNHGKLLRWWDRKGKVNVLAVPDCDWICTASKVIKQLVNRGLRISPAKHTIEYLTKYVTSAEPIRHYLCTPRTGWINESFVFPDRVIGATDVVYQGGETSSPIRQAGSLEEWKENVGRLCCGNSRLLFAVSAAFASATLEIVGAESGGIHIYGGTSSGKTTAAQVAASVWIDPRQLGTWNSTINGFEDIAEAHNHLLLTLDEIGQADIKVIGKTTYMLGNGVGKKRYGHPSKRWQLLFLSTGELTLQEALEAAGLTKMGGQGVRLLDIPVDAGMGMGGFEHLHELTAPDAFANQLKAETRKYHGVAGDTFVRQVALNKIGYRQNLNRTITEFVTDAVPPSAPGHLNRAARKFAIIAAAGELATDLGITGWKPGEAINAAKTCMDAWLMAKESTGSFDVAAAIEQVKDFLKTYGMTRFQFLSDRRTTNLELEFEGYKAPDRVLERAGYRKDTSTGVLYMIHPTVFRAEVCQGFDSKAVIEALIRRGHAIKDKEPGRLTLSCRTQDGVDKLYAIKDTLLADDQKSGNNVNSGNVPSVPGVPGNSGRARTATN